MIYTTVPRSCRISWYTEPYLEVVVSHGYTEPYLEVVVSHDIQDHYANMRYDNVILRKFQYNIS
mgnify:CR=1 FL=1